MGSLIIISGLLFVVVCILSEERAYYRNECYKLLHKNEELAAENHHLKVKYDEIPIVSYDT
jgi:FtsZ-binding cell division protein ZapB